MLAMKKEALKTEAEQIDQILIDAGIDPHDFKDFNERKQMAETLTASHQEDEERRKKEQKEQKEMLLAFEREAVKKREAGLVNDDEGDDDENDDQKSSRSGEGKKKRVKRKTTEKARDDSTDEDDVAPSSARKSRKIASDTEEGSDHHSVPEKPASSATPTKVSAAATAPKEAISATGIDESSFPDFDQVMAQHNAKKESGSSKVSSSVAAPKRAISSTRTDKSSFPDFDQVLAQYNAKTEQGSSSLLPDDDILSQYSDGFVRSNNTKTFRFFKSKNTREVNARGDDDDVKIDDASDDDDRNNNNNDSRKNSQSRKNNNSVSGKDGYGYKISVPLDKVSPKKSASFLDEAGEKADRVAKTEPPNFFEKPNIQSILSTPLSLIKGAFAGFASPVKEGGRYDSSAPSTSGCDGTSGAKSEKKTESSKRKEKTMVALVKDMYSDPIKKAKLDEWRSRYEELKAQTKKNWLVKEEEEGRSFSIPCLANVTLIPGTLIVDTEAPPKTAVSRAIQGGVQPMRSCRMKQPLLTINQALAKVKEDPDSEDDFVQNIPLRRRVKLSTKKPDSQSVIEVEDEEELPDAPDQFCPICNRSFAAKQIEKHVNKCLSSQEEKQSGSGDDGDRSVRTRKKVSDDGDFLQR